MDIASRRECIADIVGEDVDRDGGFSAGDRRPSTRRL